MKFPPKECPACGSIYWNQREDSTGDQINVWKAEDRHWYHGPSKLTTMIHCPSCGFGFTRELVHTQVPTSNFLAKLVAAYRRFIRPVVTNRLLTNLPPGVYLENVAPNRAEGYMDVTLRFILKEKAPDAPTEPPEAPAETPEEA